jgi:hypothetical protein
MLLLSFLPYIRDMQETELMDPQMKILTIKKKNKQKRMFQTPGQVPSPAGSYRSPLKRKRFRFTDNERINVLRNYLHF